MTPPRGLVFLALFSSPLCFFGAVFPFLSCQYVRAAEYCSHLNLFFFVVPRSPPPFTTHPLFFSVRFSTFPAPRNTRGSRDTPIGPSFSGFLPPFPPLFRRTEKVTSFSPFFFLWYIPFFPPVRSGRSLRGHFPGTLLPSPFI